MVTPNRSELARLRGKTTPQALADWTTAFGGGDTRLAARYDQVLVLLLGSPSDAGDFTTYVGTLSPGTRRQYGRQITEFFEWVAQKHGRVVPPHEVTRKDAEDFVTWLSQRPFGLQQERLKDGDRPEWLALFEVVSGLGQATLPEIAGKLPAPLKKDHATAAGGVDEAWLGHALGQMVIGDFLARTPTLDTLRKQDPEIGISRWELTVDGRDIPLSHVFTYRVPEPRAVARVTIASYLTALSELWRLLARGGPGEPPLLQHDVWADVKRRTERGLSAEKRQARARKRRLSGAAVRDMLGVVDQDKGLVARRDAALFWFLLLCATRSRETRGLRRGPPPPADAPRVPGWFDARAEPPAVELLRKGGVRKRIPYPPLALRALHAFEAELEARAAPHGSQDHDPDAPLYIPPGSFAWRCRRLLEPDAPLFPSIAFWGANAGLTPNPRALRPMSAHGLRSILKRIAEKAGLTPEELSHVHPHALRHFAAGAMLAEGKDIREIQFLLGHGSITTTETYLPDDTDIQALSGQREILAHVAKAPPRGVAPPAPVVETFAVPPRAAATPPPGAPAPEPERQAPPALPAPEPAAELPAQSPQMDPGAVAVHETASGTLVAVAGDLPPVQDLESRDGISPGAPTWAYEALEPGATVPQDRLHFTRVNVRRPLLDLALPTLYQKKGKDQVQQEPWLREHYASWPQNYGLGEATLLPWFARGSANRNGEVTVEVRGPSGKQTVVVPPIPVLSPEQLYPEVEGRTLFSELETLTAEWMRTSPSKVFGVRRWFGAFAVLTSKLEIATKRKLRWIPFEGLGKTGEDLRAHDDAYLVKWLTQNAERYTTTVRAFEEIQRPRGDAYDENEWMEFTEAFQLATYQGVSPSEEIPEWFTFDDPVREIYDRDPDEWEWFEKWLGSITGQQMTAARRDDRDAKLSFAESDREERIRTARQLLEHYFTLVSEISDAEREGDTQGAARYRLLLRGGSALEVKALKMGATAFSGLTQQLAELGVPDPATQKGLPEPIPQRVEVLLAKAFPDTTVDLIDPNVLRSQLFDPRTFRIDPKAKTIVHTEAFRAEFAQRFDGRDSECVVRRAARGMWEHVKRHGIQIKKGERRSTEYSLLYSVFLSYMSWTVPCPPEMEARMAAQQSALRGEDARAEYLTAFNRAISEALTAGPDQDREALIQLALSQGLDALSAQEALEAAVLYSGGAAPTSGDLTPNRSRGWAYTPNAAAEGARSALRAEQALPSALQMIAAMTTAF